MPPNAEPAFTSYEGSCPSVEVLLSPTEDAEKPAMELEEPCPICLYPITGDAFLDPCFHKFCYHCILQWAEMVFTHPSMQGETFLECPICKTRSSCIIHSLFLDTFKRHYLFGIPPSQNHPFPLSPAHYQRLYMYKNSLQTSVEQVLNQNVKSRRRLFFISGNANVQQWVQRELQALMQVEDVDLITQHLLGVLKHCEVKQQGASHTSVSWIDEMRGAVEPFLFENAETFCGELRMFLSCGLNVEAYDLVVEEALRANTLKLLHTSDGWKFNLSRLQTLFSSSVQMLNQTMVFPF